MPIILHFGGYSMEFNQRELNYLLNCLNYHYENLDFKAPHIMELNAELCKKLDKQRRLQEIESNQTESRSIT